MADILAAIQTNDRETLLAAEQPMHYDIDDDDIWDAVVRFKNVSIETHRTLFDIGLISKTNMQYLEYFISRTTCSRDENHLEMLLHVMDHPTIAEYRVEEYDKSDSIADLMCYCVDDVFNTRIPKLLEYVVDVIGVNPTIPGWFDVPFINRAIRNGWVHLVDFLLERGVRPVSDDDNRPILAMIVDYKYQYTNLNMASTIADMLELLAAYGCPFAEQAPGLAAKLVDAGLPAVEPRLAQFAVIA